MKYRKPEEYPPLIPVGKATYHLIFVDRLAEDDLGVCDDKAKLIMISKRQTPEEMEATVYHELLHAIECEYRLKLGHPVIRKLEWAMAQVVRGLSKAT